MKLRGNLVWIKLKALFSLVKKNKVVRSSTVKLVYLNPNSLLFFTLKRFKSHCFKSLNGNYTVVFDNRYG